MKVQSHGNAIEHIGARPISGIRGFLFQIPDLTGRDAREVSNLFHR
jgi:hypothetical protein